MNKEIFLSIAKGLFTRVLGYKGKAPAATGGTINSRYCYAIWMRHIVAANNNGFAGVPGTIAELGPGDSIGIGLAALLSGSEHYYALEIYKYWDAERNIRIFDELVELFKNKTPIPGTAEFPRVIPVINELDFPTHIFTDAHLQKCLAPGRISSIRNEILNPGKSSTGFIQYFIPWYDKKIAEAGTVDFIISQSVIQYVDDVDATYAAMHSWLKKGGMMSHSLDLSSLGTTKVWNGHWLFTNWQWNLARGKKKQGLNRAPQSVHLMLNEKYGFEVVQKNGYTKDAVLPLAAFAKGYKGLTAEDISVAAMFIQSVKK